MFAGCYRRATAGHNPLVFLCSSDAKLGEKTFYFRLIGQPKCKYDHWYLLRLAIKNPPKSRHNASQPQISQGVFPKHICKHVLRLNCLQILGRSDELLRLLERLRACVDVLLSGCDVPAIFPNAYIVSYLSLQPCLIIRHHWLAVGCVEPSPP